MGGRILSILLGIAILVFGVSLLGHPLKGVISLTYMAGIMMLLLGVLRILLAFSAQATGLRGVLILSGLVSLVLGGMIFANWPQAAAVVLGLFLAIELISNGISLIVLSFSRKTEGASL